MATHPESEFEQYRHLLDDLARAVPRPPDVRWGHYRAELRAKIAARPERQRAWPWRPAPLALSAGLAGLLLVVAFFALQSGRQSGIGVDFAGVEGAAIGGQLGLLEQYRVVERLDLLEEFDVIRDLEGLTAERTG